MKFSILKNFSNYKICLFINTFLNRIEFNSPPKTDIVIYDEQYKEAFLNLIPQSKKVFILKNPSIIYLNFKFIFQLIKNIFNLRLLSEVSELIKTKGYFIGFRVYLKDINEFTVLNLPCKCLVRIDNNSRIEDS